QCRRSCGAACLQSPSPRDPRGAALPLAMPVTVTELPQAFRAVTTIDHDAELLVGGGFADIAFGHQDA
ncbi:MAG: hypothetical protein OXJ64_19085, partial [Boseongicola sp.]|nr:hypothetical protein [Boseongicola sp.]